MKYFFYFLTIILLTALNLGLFPYFRLFGGLPNLLLIFVVIAALDRESFDCFFIALCSGLFLDINTGSFFGTYSFAFLLIAGFLQILVNNFIFFNINWKYAVVVLFMSTLGLYIFVYFYTQMTVFLNFNSAEIGFLKIKNRLLPDALYNLLMLLPIYKLSDFIKVIIARVYQRKTMI